MTRQNFLQLIQALEETPRLIRQLTGHLTDDEVRWKPSDRDFSALEHLCHLNDIEREGYAIRIEKLVHEEQPFLPDIDGAKLAAERDYNIRAWEATLKAFCQAREDNVSTLKELTPDQWNRRGLFEHLGPLTLRELLSMMVDHDREHLRALSDLSQRFGRAKET